MHLLLTNVTLGGHGSFQLRQLIANFIANLVTPLGICKYFTENSVNKPKVTKGTVLPVCFGADIKPKGRFWSTKEKMQ